MIEYRKVKINGLDIFYREAGLQGNPTVLLLHGFPTSSHMFRNLMHKLEDKYHLVASFTCLMPATSLSKTIMRK